MCIVGLDYPGHGLLHLFLLYSRLLKILNNKLRGDISLSN